MLAKSVDAKVRPLSNTSLEKSSLLGAARIYVSKDTLISLTGGLENGKHCLVTKLESNTRDAKDEESQLDIQREASLWILPEKNLSPNVVMMTRAFQEASGFKLGDQVRIELTGTTPDAAEIQVQDLAPEKSEFEKDVKYTLSWEGAIAYFLDRAEFVFPGMVVEAIMGSKLRRSFQILTVNSQPNTLARYQRASTQICIVDPNDEATTSAVQTGGELVVTGVPGMSGPIKALNSFLRPFNRPLYIKAESESCGFVIYGGSGTGKSFILKRIADTNWGRVHWIKPSDKISVIRETLKLAQTQQPSMILIDQLDRLVNKDRSNRDSVVDAIGEELDSLYAAAMNADQLPKVVVIATCTDYNDIPTELTSLSRFSENVALTIPRTPERQEILDFLAPPVKADERQQLIANLAQRTHAYNPNDLAKLMRNAKRICGQRLEAAGVDPSSEEEHHVSKADLDQALRVTRPSAMHNVNLNPPTIHWQDIGGQESLKKALLKMIKHTKSPERSLRPPPKGLLLYGPPGCSKTLSAQAAATESGFNFFAVKGAELLNMYVGESERALRSLFEQARNASPSIIFFDEIDSIGGQRTGSGSASRSTGAVNMLTTLLTEMDGFELLSGVIVLAATNRPEAMDPALMRPGRFDQILYVGPPDDSAREAVFNVHLRGLPLASDVDIPELGRLAEGHSGVEIKAVCDEACFMVQDRYDDDEANNKLEISMADLKTVLERTPRRITEQMIAGYEKWARQFKKA